MFEIAANVFRSRTAKNSGLLIGMQGLSMLLSMMFTILITRGLDVAAYGMFRYAMTFLALGMTLLQFGWPNSAARLLALESEPAAQKQIVGACVIMLGISSGIGTVVALVGFVAAKTLGFQLPRVLLWVTPFLYVTLSQYMIGSICQGLNRISLLSFQQVLPYILLLPITAVQLYVFGRYSLYAAVIGYVAVFSAVIMFGFLRLGVAFSHLWIRVLAIARENRHTGFPIYIGSVFGVASAQIVAMWVADFTDLFRYGQFALALAVSAPLSVLISSVGTVVFQSSSRSKALSNRILFFSFGLGGSLGLLYVIATEVLLVRLFGSQYQQSVQMAQLLGIGSLLIGWGDIFNRFLGAQGQGNALCLAAVSTGSVGIISAVILLPKWNVYGAVVSSILAASTYLTVMMVLYVRHTARLRRNVMDVDSVGQKV